MKKKAIVSVILFMLGGTILTLEAQAQNNVAAANIEKKSTLQKMTQQEKQAGIAVHEMEKEDLMELNEMMDIGKVTNETVRQMFKEGTLSFQLIRSKGLDPNTTLYQTIEKLNNETSK